MISEILRCCSFLHSAWLEKGMQNRQPTNPEIGGDVNDSARPAISMSGIIARRHPQQEYQFRASQLFNSL